MTGRRKMKNPSQRRCQRPNQRNACPSNRKSLRRKLCDRMTQVMILMTGTWRNPRSTKLSSDVRRRKHKCVQISIMLPPCLEVLLLMKIRKQRIQMSHLERSQVPSHQAKKTGRRLPSRYMRRSSNPRPVCQASTSTSSLTCLHF